MSDLLLWFALIAAVLIVTALASKFVERSPLSFSLIFLGFGLALGEWGFGIIDMGPKDPVLEVIATLTLSLVLFLDATRLQLDELGRRWLVPALILGPGTGLIIILGAVPLTLLLGFAWVVALIGGAVLASTDPVVLREILRDDRIPRSVRQILKLEAGMNDIVVLPVILVLIAVAQGGNSSIAQWTTFLTKLLLVGPALGFFIGGLGSWLMARVDNRMAIRSEYQALYGIGLVLGSYAVATAAGGDGFLASFAAGVAVVVLNQSLCDCFLEYGEVTAEMAMLLTLVLFGAVLSTVLGAVSLSPALLMAFLVIFVLRPSIIGLVLSRAKMSWEAHAFVAWFGPRGLNSLLLMLLVVHAEVPGAELLLATVGVVVLASVTLHGASATPVSVWYGRRAARAKETLAEERESTAAGLFDHDEREVHRIVPDALQTLLDESTPPIILDVRSRSSYDHDGAQIPGSIRVLPDHVITWASDQPRDRLVVAYCT